MSRTWAELLGDEEPGNDEEPERRRFRRLRSGLSKSRRAIATGLTGWRYDPSDLETWEQLEEALIAADVGVATTQEVVERLGRIAAGHEGQVERGRLLSSAGQHQPDLNR